MIEFPFNSFLLGRYRFPKHFNSVNRNVSKIYWSIMQYRYCTGPFTFVLLGTKINFDKCIITAILLNISVFYCPSVTCFCIFYFFVVNTYIMWCHCFLLILILINLIVFLLPEIKISNISLIPLLNKNYLQQFPLVTNNIKSSL